ncbi:MAG TPA: FAD-binding and (Fe-S)-binding domain-containing protein [Opitutaceae bacterium]|nr:FAD-binding and (Fe-S)-binding domain-containing protein [Opitutaceae bacterium]
MIQLEDTASGTTTGTIAGKNRRGELQRKLEQAITGEVRFSDGDRALYSTDASNYRMPPIGVVLPRTRQDIIEVVRICREFGAPLLSRGGGTSLAGQCCNHAVVMDLSKYYNRILKVDTPRRLITVETGIVLDKLQIEARKHGLVFGPNPATHDHCTIGGMLGNNSCGINSMLAALHGNGYRTSDNVETLEVLTYDGEILHLGPTSDEAWEAAIRGGGRRGEIYAKLRDLRDRYADEIRGRFPKIPRRVSGYSLDDLLPENGANLARAVVGSEATCVVILSATLRLVPNPKARSLLVLGYPDAFQAGDHVTDIFPFRPIGLEGIDRKLVDSMRKHHLHPEALELLPEGGGWLLVEFGGDSKEDADNKAKRVMEELKKKPSPPSMKLYDDPQETHDVWEAREAGLGATAFVKGEPDTWEGWEDSAVPPEKVGAYLRELHATFQKHGYDAALYGHYGQGCIHCRANFDLTTAEGLKNFRSFLDDASDLVVRFGGSFSGEHGDGQSRAELLPKLFGPRLIEAFNEFKTIWDPEWKMNPGKVVDPNPILSHLRLGTDYNPARPKTYFSYPEDNGDFSRAVLRCVGVGKCRQDEAGTMCPSYMATREEKHSTRGRSRLLFEMLRGELITDGFHNEDVKDALDLCLACKGCKGDCPVHVDMATYKAEYLAHHYKHHLRPLHAYAFGLIGQWARIGSRMPGLANFFQRAPIFSEAMKGILGVAPERKIPRFAARTFKDWYFSRPAQRRTGAPVILWPDTFNNYYHPEVARAAVDFLERAGWRVIVPRAALCCGRPLYDYGMLDTARSWMLRIIDELRGLIRAGVPMIGLEPSCVATFRDELVNLLPLDEDGKRLSQQTFMLSEFIEKKMPHYPLPQLQRRALVHGHCHQKALMKMTDEQAVLKKIGLDVDMPDSGCCGMAGAFGFEKDHYDVSIACGERVLLPKVREAPAETLIVADGFSCREQIAQTTERRALHLAQVLELANGARRGRTPRALPERLVWPTEKRDPSKTQAVLALGLGLGLVAAVGFVVTRRLKAAKG